MLVLQLQTSTHTITDTQPGLRQCHIFGGVSGRLFVLPQVPVMQRVVFFVCIWSVRVCVYTHVQREEER